MNIEQIKLGNILTGEQIERVLDITGEHTEYVARTLALKEYLSTIREQLHDKGVLPEYLAYVIVYNLEQLEVGGKTASAGFSLN